MPGPQPQNQPAEDAVPAGIHTGSDRATAPEQLCRRYPGLRPFAEYPVATLVFNIDDKKILFWNQPLTSLTGYERDEVPTVIDFIDKLVVHSETRAVYKQILTMPLDLGELQRSPMTCLNRAEEDFFAELQLWQPRTDDYPERCRILHMLRLSSQDPMVEYLQRYNLELDNQIQANQSELERHKQWLEMALEGSREGLWTIDFKSGKMDFAYANVLNILGYTREEMEDAPLTWDGLTHPDDLPEVQRRLEAHFAGETPYYECQYRAKAKNGEWRWILGHGRVISRDEHGRPLEAVGTHIDISQLKKTEESLRYSEALFRNLVESAPIAIMLVEESDNVLYTNPRFLDLFGFAQDEIGSLPAWWEASSPDAAARKSLLAALKDNPAKGVMTDVRCKDGSIKHALLQLVEMPNGRKLVAYEDMSAQIISERALQKREKELQEKSEKLEEMNAALRVLLNRMNTDREELEHKMFVNIRDMIMPYVDKLESISHSEAQQSYLNIIKTNLQNVVSSFNLQLAKQSVNLTPRELQIANMINEGMTNKDISAILYISNSAVEFHRHNIRKKLNIVDKKVNLKTHLRSIL